METVFIDRKDTQLTASQGRLNITFKAAGRQGTSIPLHQLKSLVISCDCELTSGMLRTLAKHNISLVCLNNRDPQASFIGGHPQGVNVVRREYQYRLVNSDQALQLAIAVVRLKIRRQQQCIEATLQRRFDKRQPLLAAKRQLWQARASLNRVTSNDELLGVEGSAARCYFEAYRCLFADSLAFTRRQRRPPPDPVNALLSLTYTMVYYEAIRSCHGSGLDCYFGVLHQASYGRASLACDLSELIRGDVDQWVLSLFNRQVLTAQYFQGDGVEGCKLSKQGRSIYYRELQECLPQWRKQLRYAAAFIARLVDRSSGDGV